VPCRFQQSTGGAYPEYTCSLHRCSSRTRPCPTTRKCYNRLSVCSVCARFIANDDPDASPCDKCHHIVCGACIVKTGMANLCPHCKEDGE